ncbi:MAG: hypothetical protein ACOC1K_05975 [Nanoarchaeota archaeon]
MAKVMIAIISDKSVWPTQFSLSLIELIRYTASKHQVSYFHLSGCNVNNSRNKACLIAQNKGIESCGFEFDYLVQLDDDHIYERDFIDKFIKLDKDIVVGCTNKRIPPFNATQYKEIKGIGMQDKENQIDISKIEGLEKVGSSGPVGMTIKVDVFKRLKFPYFKEIYLNESPSLQGGDIYFSQMCKDANIPIYLDKSVSFPHKIDCAFVDRNEIKFYH